MTPFVYTSAQRGLLTTTTYDLDQLKLEILSFEKVDEIRVEDAADHYNVYIGDYSAPVGRINALAVLAPVSPTPPLPKSDQPVIFTVEFTMIPDQMIHQSFHLAESKETKSQRITGLRACMVKELELCFKARVPSLVGTSIIDVKLSEVNKA